MCHKKYKRFIVYKQILRDTFASVFDKSAALFKALIIPTVLLVIFQYFMGDATKFYTDEIINYYILVPSILLTLIFNITIAITTHRILLLGNNSVPSWGIFTLTRREVKFSFKFIKIFLCIIALSLVLIILSVLIFFLSNFFIELPALVQSLIPLFSMLLVFVAVSILGGLFLVLPATATENELSIKNAWKLSKNYRLLCFVTILLVPNLFGALFGFAYGLVIDILVKLISTELNVLYPILNVFISVFTISALSHTYKYLISLQNDSNTEDEKIDEENLFHKEEENVESILQTVPQDDNK